MLRHSRRSGYSSTPLRRLSAGRRLRFESLEDRRVLATLWVDPTVPNGKTIFTKIGDAVAAAHSGDTIKVVAGTYIESVNVDKSLTIIGGQVRVPNGSSGSSVLQSSVAFIGFFLNANNITIRNFTVKFETAGILANGAFAGFRILSNHFEQNTTAIAFNSSPSSTLANKIAGNSFSTGFGTVDDSITVDGQARNLTISGNMFQAADLDAAIRVDGIGQSKNVQILNNVFTSAATIKIANTTGAKIIGNTITNPTGTAAIRLAGKVTGSEVANNVLFSNAVLPPHAILMDQNLAAGTNSGNKIHGNTIDGLNFGIWAFVGTNNSITGNTITQCKSDGVILDFGANSNTVSSNTITDNDGSGVDVKGKNTVSKNIASNNGLSGITLFESNTSSIWGNTVNHNAKYGIDLITANSNLVAGNTIKFNQLAGIFLEQLSGKNTLSGNNASFNDAGVSLSNSAQNTLSSNTARNNHTDGFQTTASSNSNMFSKNVASGNLGAGFKLQSNSNTLTSNTANGNGGDGFQAQGIFNDFRNNIANGNGANGILLVTSGATLVASNTVMGNAGRGIVLSASNNNAVTSNKALNNVGDGIAAIFNSGGNIIHFNTAMGNGVSFGGFDLLDLTVGGGTAGTANTWASNTAATRDPIGLV